MNLKMTIRALLATPLALALPFGASHAAPQYITTDLGTLGGKLSQAPRINEAGQVAGFSSTESSATMIPFLWQEGLGLQPLATLGGSHAQALNINDGGQVVGVSYLAGDTATRGFIAGAGAAPKELPTLGGNTGRALAINGNGVVTGAAAQANGNELGVVWPAAAGAPVSLRTFNNNGLKSQGNDINSAGTVVGYADNGARSFHAAAWIAPYTSVPTDLGALGGTNSEAYAVNENGQVTGYANVTGDTGHRAFLWQPGSAMRDLGRLGTGNFSEGYDINAAGDVVGYSTTTGDAARRAVIRRAAGTAMEDLNGLVLPNQGWIFTEAYGINNGGQIVGLGTLTRTDTVTNTVKVERHAFLLTPDKILPTITCPAAIRTTGNQPASIGTAVATDNLDPNPTLTSTRPASFPNGDTTVTWTATDAAGNKGTCTQLVTIAADTTPPVVAPRWTPADPDGANGWYISAPSLAWSITDAESAISSRVGCVASTLSADTASQSFNCSATSTGGTTGPVTTTVKLDRVAPTLTAPAAVTADTTAFEAATVTFANPTATDGLSGLDTASLNCSPASGSSFKLGANTVTCNAKDLAGNAATPASFTVTVKDPSAPVVTPSVTGPQGSAGWYKGPVTVSFAVSDAESTITGKDLACDTPNTVSADGANQVACSATSAGGTTTSAQVVNIDATPPTVTAPANVVAEATGPTGAVVTIPNGSYSDTVSGPANGVAVCAPATGTFALGASTVKCSAADNAGNTGEASFTVTVQDTTKPTLNLPGSLSASTTDPNGASVSYVASASDAVSGTLSPSCSTPTGSVFPIGTTTVSCSASDQAGNIAEGSFAVTVTETTTPPPGDTVAPVLSLPADIVTTATSEAGAIVSYTATAVDAVSGPANVSCSPASGTLFAVGTWPVSCSATDTAGNTATGQFSVTVNALPPVETVADAAIAGNPTTLNNVRRQANTTYTFRVTNAATAGTLTGAIFTHTVPTSLSFGSATTTGGSCTQANRVVTCNLAALAPGAGVNVSVTARTSNNRSTVNADGRVTASGDANTLNNTARVTINVNR